MHRPLSLRHTAPRFSALQRLLLTLCWVWAGSALAGDLAEQLDATSPNDLLLTCVQQTKSGLTESADEYNTACTSLENDALMRELQVTLRTTAAHLPDGDDQEWVDPWANFDELMATTDRRISPKQVDTALLSQLAAEIVVALPEPDATTMEKLRRWLKEILARFEWWDELSDWLSDFAPSLAVHPSFFWIVALAFILGTVGFVVYEFWRAGFFRANRTPKTVAAGISPDGMPAARARSIRELSGVSQAQALFSAALGEMRAAGALPASNSYTNRNLALLLNRSSSSTALADDVAEQFQSLQQFTDLALYANRPPVGEQWDALVDYWVDGKKIS